MSKALITVGVIAISAVACAPRPESTPGGATSTDVPAVTVPLPAGDVGAGRQAFMDLRCTACHAVPSEPAFPAPVSVSPGPPIDARLAGRDVSYVLTAIMSPSHAMSTNTSAAVRARLEGTLSPMGDFSQVRTVRQLIDLHAYVRSVK
jgi:hypothetical protein